MFSDTREDGKSPVPQIQMMTVLASMKSFFTALFHLYRLRQYEHVQYHRDQQCSRQSAESFGFYVNYECGFDWFEGP